VPALLTRISSFPPVALETASRAALIEEAAVGSSCTVSMPASDRSVTDARDREAAKTWRPNEIHQYATALQQL
jgi:hypothetical protein